jgi:hypothetical protein
MKIIAIAGLAGSGKDTIADILVNEHGYVKISLADVMKRFVRELWNIPDENLWGPSHLRSTELPIITPSGDKLTVRKILQHFGTEGGRAIDHDVWIRYTMRIAQLILSNTKYHYSYLNGWYLSDKDNTYQGVIVPDCRFINECEYIKAAGGILWRVKRPGAGLQGQFALHRSEQEMLSVEDVFFEHIIENNGTIDDLKEKVKKIV